MVAVLVDLKEETQKAVAAALATQAQTEREPQLRQHQPRSVLIWNAERGCFRREYRPGVALEHPDLTLYTETGVKICCGESEP